MKINKVKCCVLLSGGIDSTTATYWALNRSFETEAIYFSLGESKPERGLECSMKVADKTGIRLHVLKVPLTQEGYLSLLPLNRLTQDEKRNGCGASVFASLVMWLTLGAGFCEKENIRRLVLGLNLNNVKKFKGITREFFGRYEDLFEGWMGRRVEIVTPFLEAGPKTRVCEGEGGSRGLYRWSP